MLNVALRAARLGIALVLTAATVAIGVALISSQKIALATPVFRGTLLVEFVVALPVYVFLRQLRRETWLSCMVAGTAIGSIPAILLVATGAGGSISTAIAEISMLGGVGASGGFVFWGALRLLQKGVVSPVVV